MPEPTRLVVMLVMCVCMKLTLSLQLVIVEIVDDSATSNARSTELVSLLTLYTSILVSLLQLYNSGKDKVVCVQSMCSSSDSARQGVSTHLTTKFVTFGSTKSHSIAPSCTVAG